MSLWGENLQLKPSLFEGTDSNLFQITSPSLVRLVVHVVAISLYWLPSSIKASSSKIASVSPGGGLVGVKVLQSPDGAVVSPSRCHSGSTNNRRFFRLAGIMRVKLASTEMPSVLH